MLQINKGIRIKRNLCKIIGVAYMVAFLFFLSCGFAVQLSNMFGSSRLSERFMQIGKDDFFYMIAAIIVLLSYHTKKYLKRMKLSEYEVKNLVFSIIDEDTFIDAEYMENLSQVKIVFYDDENFTIEEFMVDCAVTHKENVDDDTLVIKPNSAELILKIEREEEDNETI